MLTGFASHFDGNPTSDALRAAFAALDTLQPDPDARSVLQRELCQYVDRARDDNRPPERVIVEVKQIGSSFGFLSRAATSGETDSREKLLSEVVLWCIHRYYGVQPDESDLA